MSAELEALEARIGYRFADRALLHRALTHRSRGYERLRPGTQPPPDNEELEFLGDSVLGLLVAEHLVRTFPGYREGRLSKLKHHLVNAAHLYEAAKNLDLGSYLQMGRGEELTGGRTKKTVLANGLEALIAAVYLDGGIDPARGLVSRTVLAAAGENFGQDSVAPIDFKGALRELTQARRMPDPRYRIVGERGPAHDKTFTVELTVGKEWQAMADGASKKSAEQQAARDVYDRILIGSLAGA
jgi:ribonuclease III